MQQRGGDGNLPLFFADVIIGDGRAVRDPTHAADSAAGSDGGRLFHARLVGSGDSLPCAVGGGRPRGNLVHSTADRGRN